MRYMLVENVKRSELYENEDLHSLCTILLKVIKNKKRCLNLNPGPWKSPFTLSSTVTNLLMKDLLNGSANYIKGGKLYFTRIIITDKTISLYDKNKKLGIFTVGSALLPGGSLTFDLIDGQIGIKLH